MVGVVFAVVLLIAFGNAGYRNIAADMGCSSNFHGMGNWLYAYAADYDDTFPSANWMDGLKLYAWEGYGEEAFRCQVLTRNEPDAYGYALNTTFAGKRAPASEDNNRIPMVFETSLRGKNAVGGLQTFTRKGRHRGKSYVTFGGCSVRSIPDGQVP